MHNHDRNTDAWWLNHLSEYVIFTNAGCVMLGEARGTLASEATDGVNTQELTVMLFGRALIQIWKWEVQHETSALKKKLEAAQTLN